MNADTLSPAAGEGLEAVEAPCNRPGDGQSCSVKPPVLNASREITRPGLAFSREIRSAAAVKSAVRSLQLVALKESMNTQGSH